MAGRTRLYHPTHAPEGKTRACARLARLLTQRCGISVIGVCAGVEARISTGESVLNEILSFHF